MEKIDFQCDYLEGCHPAILQVLQDSNLEQTPGYGNDPYCVRAAMRIREACACEAAEVHFLVGGTQTNLLAISALLRPYQGVLCAEEGHIATHETGAIEATGHKVLTLPDTDGRITAAQVETYCRGRIGRARCRNTRCSRAWYISRSQRSAARCIRVRSWWRCTSCAKSTACRCMSTGRGSGTRWRRRKTI
ncbi:MAG: beta-eliminating lyase-related protein [Christensenellaceae bacterium]